MSARGIRTAASIAARILKEILFTAFYSPDVALTIVKCDYDWVVGKYGLLVILG